jgi:predicted DNA-binding transcriptional regulator AlpA
MSATTRAKLLTVDEVAERLRVSRFWVRDHMPRKNGRSLRTPMLPGCVRLSTPGGRGAVRFREEEIERYIAECTVEGPIEMEETQ